MAQGSNAYAVQPHRKDITWDQTNQDANGQLAYFSPENDEEDAVFMHEAFAMRDDEAWGSDKMTAKVPPAYDGLTSFFAYEEYVEEWLLITTIDEDKRAPLLRFRLKGNALTVKRLLNQDKLQQPGAIKYFLDTLRPFFVKDRGHVFLWRFLRLFKFTRGNSDITMWIPRYQIMFQKVVDSWMDLLEPVTNVMLPHYQHWIDAQNHMIHQQAQAAGNMNPPLYDFNHPDALDMYNSAMATVHRQKFAINDHLMVMMFIVASDLSEQQRRDITTNLTQRGIKMADYTWIVITEVFRDLLCSTKTGINDPNVRPHGQSRGKGRSSGGHRRSFIIDEEGDFEEDEGWWVVDEETGEEGFLSQFDDTFYTPKDEWGNEWEAALVVGRFLRKHNGKGRKGKRGNKRRGKFRPRRKGKGQAHVTNNEDDYYEEYDYGEESYYGFKGGKGKRSKGKGRGKKGGKFPFGKGYETFEIKGKTKGKGKHFGKTPKDGKANVAGAQPASSASDPNATDGSTWNGSPYGNQTNSHGEDWCAEYYDSTTGHTWYTEDGVG